MTDLDSSVPQRISFAEAEAIVDAATAAGRLPQERVALANALGRVLADDLVASVPLPPFDNSAMDGFAVRSDDTGADVDLRLVGERFAGDAGRLVIGTGECARVTTGAMLPSGADAIAIKEDVRADGSLVRLSRAVRAGTHLRRQGEDVAVGDTVLHAGDVLTPARSSLAAALGSHDVAVARRPTVAVFTTGDELVAPGQPLGPGQVYDSNRVLLQTLLQADGYQPVAWPRLPDDPAQLRAALRDAAFSFDVVFTCGGVSAGEKDHLPTLMAELGQVHFWRVRLRPGMPLLFGRLDQAWLLGLPGNPVSVFATYLTLGRRLLDGLQGRREPRPSLRARLDAPIRKTHPRREFLRGNLQVDEQGGLRVRPNPADGSHRLRAAADADALIVLPEGEGEWGAGEVVQVLPLRGA